MFSHAVKQQPRYREGLFALGTLDLQERELDNSIERFEQLLKNADDQTYVSYWIPWRVHSNYGLALYYHRDPDRAYEQMAKAVSLRGTDSTLHYHLGLIAQAQRDVSLARSHYRDCLELAPEHPLAAGNLASLEMAEGDLKEAARILEPLVQISDNSTNRYNYASVLLGLQDYKAALVQLKLLAEAFPKDYLVRAKLAWCLYEMGEPDAAQKELADARSRNARHPLIQFVEHKLQQSP